MSLVKPESRNLYNVWYKLYLHVYAGILPSPSACHRWSLQWHARLYISFGNVGNYNVYGYEILNLNLVLCVLGNLILLIAPTAIYTSTCPAEGDTHTHHTHTYACMHMDAHRHTQCRERERERERESHTQLLHCVYSASTGTQNFSVKVPVLVLQH